MPTRRDWTRPSPPSSPPSRLRTWTTSSWSEATCRPRRRGFVYGVWLSDQSSNETVYAGSFVPVSETTVVRVPFDRYRFDSVFVTLEREGAVPDEPGDVVWEEAAAA